MPNSQLSHWPNDVSTIRKINSNKHNIIRDGRKEHGIHRSKHGATNGKCNNCNAYTESCFCTKY